MSAGIGCKATTPPTPPMTAMLREAGDDFRPRCGAQPECAYHTRRHTLPQRLRRNAYAATLLQRVFLQEAGSVTRSRGVVKPDSLGKFRDISVPINVDQSPLIAVAIEKIGRGSDFRGSVSQPVARARDEISACK